MRLTLSSRLFVANIFQMSSASQSCIASVVPPTQRVLSIQSHTVHGFVGNKAATFPLQCLGFNVDAINSISLSNHPDYAGSCKGKSLGPEDVLAIIDGLDANNLLKYDLIISGYTRSVEIAAETAAAVTRVFAANPKAIYILDPVLGDDGKFYVPEELTDYFKSKLLPLAQIITPNHFEAEALSGIKITDFASAQVACNILHAMGPQICILKGLPLSDKSGSKVSQRCLSVILSVAAEAKSGQGMILRIDVPKIEGKFSGCGDLFTAMSGGILCGYASKSTGRHCWSISELSTMMEQTLRVMSTVVSSTKSLGGRELRIVESIDAFRAAKQCVHPTPTPLLASKPSSSAFPSAYVASGPVTGVIFDMDGTLSEPGAINYDLMYSRTGLTREGGDIMTQINNNPDPVQRAEQSRIIVEEEMLACDRVVCRPDLGALLHALHDSRLRISISTKNCELAVNKFLEIASVPSGRFYPLLTRDCLGGLSKPDPKVAAHILEVWGAEPSSVWFVGDSIDDMVCGKLAGCRTCLIITEDNTAVVAQTQYVDLAVHSLRDFGLHIGLDL